MNLSRVAPVMGMLALAAAACSAPESPAVLPPASSPPATRITPEMAGRSPRATQSAFPAVTEEALVIRVVDGDTAVVRLADGRTEKVRFIGVDTPESTRRHDPYGAEASAFTKRHLGGRVVHLERDVGERDRYGRLLAYIWIRPPRDGSAADVREGMFNATLLLEGYARTMTIPPNVRYVEMFRHLQIEARERNRGLWSAAPSPKTG